MNKTQSLCLLLTCFLFFTAAALVYYFRKDISTTPYLHVAAILLMVLMAIMAIAMLVIVAHMAMMCSQSYTKIQSNLPSIKEGKEVLVFVPLTEDTVSRLNFGGGDIFKIECNTRASVMNLGQGNGKGIVLTLTRKYGLCSQRTVDVQVDTNRKCAMLFNDQQAANVKGPGLYCVTKLNEKSGVFQDRLKSDTSLTVEYVEVHGGKVKVWHRYCKRTLGQNFASFLLSKKVEDKSHTASDDDDTISLYEVMLRGLLRSCPSSSTLIFPSDDCDENSEAWVNRDDGKLALSFLMSFSPASILSTLKNLKDKEVLEKVQLLQRYISQCDLTPDDEHLPIICERIKYKFFETHEKISSYNNIEDRLTTSGSSFFTLLRTKIEEDKEGILPGVLAIAAHQFQNDLAPDTKSNMFFVGILSEQGKHGMIKEVRELFGKNPDQTLIGDPYSLIAFDSCKLIGLQISPALKLMGSVLGPTCTAQELVDKARGYVMDIYWKNIVVPNMVLDCVEFGNAQNVSLCAGQDMALENSSDNVSIISGANVCCFGSCDPNPYSRI
ncbi:hypothetical protein ECH_0715 [Ehrlichia chaffeensis str. Arkansas]|uniref:Uncharacterized protein n=1 Tax=Ehrlichia chaffeensis (strain ATCC CRL-10679 / Arkansas) TaxID=205920 RepID=Q2GGB5_EHRCR|nr:hypothetical protein [Ehrlichia chaffeensis]ABD45179.1 hypothetical protein ECH_0715 [Ehrlichia chaffeensis str. Arkansas]